MWLALVVVLVAAAGTGTLLWRDRVSTEPSLTATGPAVTAVIERGTISATDKWDGTLEYGEPFTVNSSVEGTITWLFDQGKIVKRGDQLYRVNEQPVTLLYGAVPIYRDLAPGDSGVDVAQLEKNLVKLGYGGFTVDDDYTTGTAKAVRAWQDDIGAEETGTVARGAVVFVPDGRRVDALRIGVGDAVRPGGPVLDITATKQVVSLDADVDDRDLIDVGTKVKVALPGGDEVPGTVSATVVAEVASDDAGGGAEGGAADTEPMVQAKITLDKQVGDDLVGATVDVIVAIDQRADVLLVPVNALLALAEGGYGLEIVNDDGTTSTVPVTTGLFADGKVQVEGDGIDEGTVVGVAGR